jgi:acetylornithine/N-succinyldiaminopimelate aminotransferase
MKQSSTQSKLEDIKTKTNQYIVGNYARYDVAFEYGVGELLFDTEQKQYIDFMSGISVTNLGHGEADIIDALRTQADMLFHTSNLFYSEVQARLAEALVVNSFPGKVFFCNSGTEANEAAFKLARKYYLSKKNDAPVIVTLTDSFHGRTASAMSLTGQAKIREGFGELIAGIVYVETNNVHELEKTFEKYKGKIAALVMEPIIGEGGVIPITQAFAEKARKLTLDQGSLLIFDEIQTGMGRTGKLFCFEHFGFTPDAMSLAKGLGSGFPIGALLISEKYQDIFTPGSHGSTFGGNQMAMAVAYETIKVILSRDILKNVTDLSDFMFARLNAFKHLYPIVQEVRGRGLHIGVNLSIPSKPIAEKCLERGLVINSTANTVLRIMPPLNITIDRAADGLNILGEVLAEFS